QGNTPANGKWTVTAPNSTHLQLNGSIGDPLQPYSSGGTVAPAFVWAGPTLSKSGRGRLENLSCSAIGLPASPQLQCRFDANDGGGEGAIPNPVFQISATIGSNAGRSFATLPDVSGVTYTCSGGPPACAISAPSLSGSLASDGTGTVTYRATLA